MRRIPSPTLLQLMKAVAFSAVASACVAPLIRNREVVTGGTREGIYYLTLFGAIVVPLAWVGLTFVIIRPGHWRDRLIFSLLLCSVAVVLSIAYRTFLTYTLPDVRSHYYRIGVLSAVTDTPVIVHAGIIVMLGAACIFLARRLRKIYQMSRDSVSGALP